MESTVSEIHRYPLRPEGYAEPLFHDRGSREEILEHFARSGWLWRASEQSAPALGQTRPPSGAQAGRFGKVIARWREVDRWWEPDGGVDAVWRLVRASESGRGVGRAVRGGANAG